MLRLLQSPLRIPIPDRPAATVLAHFRDATIEAVAARCAVLKAGRARALTAGHATRVTAAESSLRETSDGHPIAHICRAAGGEAGIELLAIIAAPSLAPGLRNAYLELQSDLHLGIDREVLRSLVSSAVSDGALSEWCGLGGVFERLGLIEIVKTGSGRELSVPTSRLLALFDGNLVSDPRLASIVQWRECARRDAAGVLEASQLDALTGTFENVTRSCTPPLLLLVGPSGTGRTRAVQAVAAGIGLPRAAVAEAALLPRDASDLTLVVERIERDVRFLHGMLVLRGVDALELARRNALASILGRVTVPTALTSASDDLGEIERLVAIRQPIRRPSPELRRAAWSQEFHDRGVQPEPTLVEELAMDFPLTRSAVARAVELASVSDSSLAREAVMRAARSQVRSHLERYAKRILPTTRLSDLVLAEDVKEQVDELLQAVRARPELRRAMVGRAIGPNGIAALFNGPPGTGKTMTASAMAHDLGLPMYKIDVSSIVDRYVGETEKNLARIFEEAESERGLLLFDEADSLFTKRVEVSDSHDRYANMQVNMLLNLIDEYSGFVILTTNLKASIDTAFLRRMSFKVTFELPDTPEREALWRMHIPESTPLTRDVNLARLADHYRATGGEIRNAVYRALLMAPPGSPLDAARLSRAMALELEASGNVVKR